MGWGHCLVRRPSPGRSWFWCSLPLLRRSCSSRWLCYVKADVWWSLESCVAEFVQENAEEGPLLHRRPNVTAAPLSTSTSPDNIRGSRLIQDEALFIYAVCWLRMDMLSLLPNQRTRNTILYTLGTNVHRTPKHPPPNCSFLLALQSLHLLLQRLQVFAHTFYRVLKGLSKE
jgi:hypothetical protein